MKTIVSDSFGSYCEEIQLNKTGALIQKIDVFLF
jgi:hypothetical protein